MSRLWDKISSKDLCLVIEVSFS